MNQPLNNPPLRDQFEQLADKLELFIDERDIKAFLLAEAGKLLFFRESNSILDASETYLEELAERAVTRTLVGVRILGKPKADIKKLHTLALKLARESIHSLDTPLLRDTHINAVREALVLIYERFLLWMRLVYNSLYLDLHVTVGTMLKTMQKMHLLRNAIHSLSDTDTLTAARAQYFLASGGEAIRQYYELLDELERSISPRLRARTVPLSGRQPSQKTLERQGYAAPRYAYELEVTLKGLKPPIYRKLLIPGNRTLADLHLCIQDAFGWYNAHVHEFVLDRIRFGEPSDEDDTVIIWDDLVSIDELSLAVGDTMQYTYDFGDDWEHTITITAKHSLSEDESWQVLCTCLEGQRAGPPEDCGGIIAYDEILQCFAIPREQRTPEQNEYFKWAGRWNPEKCDLKAINRKLARR